LVKGKEELSIISIKAVISGKGGDDSTKSSNVHDEKRIENRAFGRRQK